MDKDELEALKAENENLKILLGVKEEELKIYASTVKLDFKKKSELKRLRNILKNFLPVK